MQVRARAAVVILTLALAGIAPAAAQAATQPVVSGAASNATDLMSTISVAVSGHYAYTTAYHAGELTAVDISHPVAPVVAGHSAPTPGLVGGSNVTIAGGYAFVVSKNRNASATSNDDGNGNSLTILDIHTDPANPAVVGTVRSTSQLFGAYGIAVSGHYAYVAYQGLLAGQPTTPDTSTGGFSVIDLTDPTNPKIVANIDNGSLPAPWTGQAVLDHSSSVAISGTVAYVTAFYSNRITAVDISDPLHPRILSSLADPVHLVSPSDIAVAGHYAYVSEQTAGTSPQLTVIDISNPAALKVVGTLNNAALYGAYRLRTRGDFAYISGSSAGTISAVDVSQPAAPRLAGFVYDPNRLNKTTGLDLDPTGSYVVASSPYLPTESNHTVPPYPPSGSSNTGTISVITLDPLPIHVSINTTSAPHSLTTQRSATFTFAVNDAVSAVQCQLDSGAFGACTSPTSASYSGLKPGTHTFTVAATDAAGHTVTASYRWTVGSPPALASGPAIAGTPAQGNRLRVARGSFTGVPAVKVTRQWQRCNTRGNSCRAIHGATRGTYTPTLRDVGHRLRVVVKATNSLGSASARSAATAVVAPGYHVSMSIAGVAAGHPTLHSSIRTYPHGSAIKRVSITLPSGLRFTSVRAVQVLDRAGHKLAAAVSLHNGALVIVLKHAQAAVTVSVGKGAMTVSRALRAKVKRKHHLPETVSLVVVNAKAQTARIAQKLRIS